MSEDTLHHVIRWNVASDGRPGRRHAALHEQHVTAPRRMRGAYSHASPPSRTRRGGDGTDTLAPAVT